MSMSTSQTPKTPGVRPSGQTPVQQTTHASSTYQNKGAAPNKPRGMGC